MKKILSAIVLAALALTGCDSEKISVTEPAQLPETGGFKVDIKINRNDVPDTKAYVKSSFATNDVVFIFFSGVDAPKYLEAKHTGTGTWTFTAKNGLTSADLEGALVNEMTAVYLPYGSGANISSNVYGDFLLLYSGGYTGYFLTSEKVAYTITDDVISGTFTLSAPELATGEVYVHFDVQGFSEGTHRLHQEYVRPVFLNYVAPDGTVRWEELTNGAEIIGYRDGANMSFSGALVASAVGVAKDYQFTIDNTSAKFIYTRDAGTKTLSSSKYIGLGDISTSTWNTTEYVDLGLPSHTLWAKCNLGADTETGYGDHYAWGETETYYSYFNPSTYAVTWKTGKEAGYDWTNYSFDTAGDGTVFSKYTGSDYSSLQSVDDVASVNLKGYWRMPTYADFEELLDDDNCTWTWEADYNGSGCKGYLVTSKINSNSIFFFAAGARGATSIYDPNSQGGYWTSDNNTSDVARSYAMRFSPSWSPRLLDAERYLGYPIRPVCKLPQ